MFLKTNSQNPVNPKPDPLTGPRPDQPQLGQYASNPQYAKQGSKEAVQSGGYSTNPSQVNSQVSSNPIQLSAQNSNTFQPPNQQPVLVNSGVSNQGNYTTQGLLLQTKTSQESSKLGERSVDEYEELLQKLTEAKGRVKELSTEVRPKSYPLVGQKRTHPTTQQDPRERTGCSTRKGAGAQEEKSRIGRKNELAAERERRSGI